MKRALLTLLALAAALGCEEPPLVHRDLPDDGICIEAHEMFADPEPGPCAPGGIAECRTGPERRVAYDERGVARLERECADTLARMP